MKEMIHIKGARQHNLKNIELKIPRNQLVVITGVSGSGKSSLALDTIYAEGQRRYVESLSAYARQFLELMDKPDVDSIDGLSPAIAIEQKSVSKNPRSTVATVTEIYDYLRLLYARIGEVFCYNCNRPIRSQTVQQMADMVMALGSDTYIHVLAPIVRGRKGEFEKELETLRRQGYTRVMVDGNIHPLEEKIVLDKKKAHSISVFIDRLVLKDGIRNRLTDSLETALKLADGLAIVEKVTKGEGNRYEKLEEFVFSEKFACPYCNVSYAEISPRLFSFNSPFGACAECNGLGTKRYFDADLIVPNPRLSIRDGAIAPWAHRQTVTFFSMLEAVAQHFNFSLRVPYEKLSDDAKTVLLNGVKEEVIPVKEEGRGGRHVKKLISFTGVIPYLEEKLEESRQAPEFVEIEKYMGETDCPSCKGSRLKKEALFIRVGGLNIKELTALSINNCLEYVGSLKLSEKETTIAKQILKEIKDRLGFLKDVGLDYLSLDRKAGTLSGGEGQRIRLATQIGSRLVGVLYILDEPSIGLHQRDNEKLIATLKSLRDLGNTVIVVEHDDETMRAADFIVDLGPGAGREGGNVVTCGNIEEICRNPQSLTGAYLTGKRSISLPRQRRSNQDRWLTIRGARGNNLQNIDVKFPIGLFTCITGVSGSGKSTLVIDTLHRLLMQHFFGSRERAGEVKSIEGMRYIDKVVDIDQSPIGRTPRSNPATYTGLFSHIRDLFALLPESKARGYGAGRYSFNVKGGRCETCSGDGIIQIEMHFLPDVFVRCDVCDGKRYNRETLEVLYRGKNISQVLELTVDDALDFFKSIPSLKQKFQTLKEVGLGYIALGQSATTLSGGEAQRIKLAKELSRRSTGKTLYILDEPTTGLHFEDIRNLLTVIQKLTDAGNTIIVIEHNLDVIRAADYVIDLGPEGGAKGGHLVACGTPEEIMQVEASHTGRFLRQTIHDKMDNKTEVPASLS
jgi:excinuclease ABC subunit A